MSSRPSIPIGSVVRRSATSNSDVADAPAQPTSTARDSQLVSAPVPVTTATTATTAPATTPAPAPAQAADAPHSAPPKAPDVGSSKQANEPKKKVSKPKAAKKRNIRHRLPLYASIAACLAVVAIWWFVNSRLAIALVVLLAAIVGGLLGRRLKSPIKTAVRVLVQAYRTIWPRAKLRSSLMALEAEHFNLRQTRRAIVAVFGPKGGVGKSTVATILAWISAMVSHEPTLIVDARHKRGNIGDRFRMLRRVNPLQAVTGTTISLRQALVLFAGGFFEDASITQTILGSVPGCKLDVIMSDQHISPSSLFIKVVNFGLMIGQQFRHYKMIVQESADELGRDFDLWLMRQCHIPMFVHNIHMPSSRAELLEGLEYYISYRDEEDGPKVFDKKIREHGVLWVLETKRGQTAEYFSEMFHGIIPPERVRLIGFHRFFVHRGNDQDPNDADEAQGKETKSPYLEFAKMPEKVRKAYLEGFNSGLRTLPALSLEDPLSPDDTTADPNGQQTTGGNPK